MFSNTISLKLEISLLELNPCDGNFDCMYKLLRLFFMSDFDECSLESSPCDENADCTNTDGSYSCTCKQGFTGNGSICEGVRTWKTIYSFFITHSVSRLCRVPHETKRHFHLYRLFCLKHSSTVLNESNVYPPRRQYAQSAFFRATRILKCLWSPSNAFIRFVDAKTQNVTKRPNVITFFTLSSGHR